MPRFVVIPCLFSLLVGLPCLAQGDSLNDAQKAEQTRQQLEQTQKDIKELQQLLRKIEQEKSGLQKQLQQTETEMGTMEQQLRELEQQIGTDETALKQLDDDQNRLAQDYRMQQQRLARHSRTIWQSGGQSAPLRLLLNAKQPAELSRTLTYYRYLGQARQQEINALTHTLSELSAVKKQTLERKAQLDQQQQIQGAKHQQLVKLREQRSALLASLNQQQSSRAARLKARQQQQTELSLVLKSLQIAIAQQAEAEARAREKARLLSHIPSGDTQNRPFAQTRGKLPWPVDGRLLARYGSPRSDDARIKWDGVLIGAAEGSTVRAIHPGQVVLADYLSGMGLMLIINHGSNYLSLYGHNQTLLKRVGDLVQVGEPVATVGKSGGQAEPALYFAIRHQKTPSDPASWCVAQNQPKR
ncbi:murein hydrolase activator EnvC family protein [Ventosimonas gracilis]|uniref:murein hydrolase activator EnvC family protein n=1 Tax=Ventosimonas gracilis TaxID=1680762 RepID=UPI0009A16187|nr:peptidoglycan DD-metalloendopeptidase family protein [Ventosimonas gracilis]